MTQQMKTIVITGASSGIGLGLTKGLLAAGHRVVATSRRASQVLQPAENLEVWDGEVAEAETARRAMAAAEQRFGGVDVLINNAGIFVPKAFEEYSREEYDRVVATNLTGFFHMTQEAVKQMKRKKQGQVITISTTLTGQPVKGVNAGLTSLTKGGLDAATRGLAMELVEHGIRVNAIAAGIIDTPMHAPEAHEFLRGLHPMPRLGRVEEIYDAVEYLLRAEFVTGEILHVDGGAHAGKW